jgi:hypothetical protein
MPSLAVRRKRELDLKLASLQKEFDEWTVRTTNEPMRRHYSQVKRLTRTLNTFLDLMTASAGWKSPTDDMVLAKGAAWEKRILTAHAIWEVFRSKLMQRGEPLFQQRLLAYDDLTWACYEPAMKHYSETPREPPLVYLNSTWSAFLRRRNVAFDKEIIDGKDAGSALNQEDYQATLKRLPIPLLGLPWFQVSHAPSALLVAHEVGHAIEFDFDLTDRIRTALSNAALTHRLDWEACASEVFADVYGCLCLGRYFAGALLDLIVADKEVVENDVTFAVYPPRVYRVEIALSTLRFLGLHSAATDVRATWEAEYGPMQTTTDLTEDAEKVVAAICGVGGMNLGAIMRPPAADIATLALYAAQKNKTNVAKESDARVLFSALRHVYEGGTPAEFARASDLLLQQVVEGYSSAFRYRGGPAPTQKHIDAALDALVEKDAATGRELEQLFGLDE